MASTTVGVLHPGNMGVSVAASAKNSGCRVLWASDGRSQETRQRAEAQDLVDVGTLAALCEASDLVIGICPPHAAEQVAADVAATGYQGLYLDANAISPMRTQAIAESMAGAGIALVDGGIVGGPAWQPGTTLYLAGQSAERVASCFSAGPLATAVLGDEIGQAAALKMCYAAWTKGTTALLCAILAVSEANGVWEPLAELWDVRHDGMDAQAVARARSVTAKAWRFAGEMQEIAATFEQAGMPGGFHSAASELYEKLAEFKGAPELPTIEDVLAALRDAQAPL